MPTLHLLPGESRGDTADIVLSSVALHRLIRPLLDAEKHGASCERFRQRDGTVYTVCAELIDKNDGHQLWRHTRLAYMRHNIRRVVRDHNGCHVDLNDAVPPSTDKCKKGR